MFYWYLELRHTLSCQVALRHAVTWHVAYGVVCLKRAVCHSIVVLLCAVGWLRIWVQFDAVYGHICVWHIIIVHWAVRQIIISIVAHHVVLCYWFVLPVWSPNVYFAHCVVAEGCTMHRVRVCRTPRRLHGAWIMIITSTSTTTTTTTTVITIMIIICVTTIITRRDSQVPIYVVNFTQRDAASMAQALVSRPFVYNYSSYMIIYIYIYIYIHNDIALCAYTYPRPSSPGPFRRVPDKGFLRVSEQVGCY